MNDNKVEQSDIEANKLAGRDINETITYSFGNNKTAISPIQALYQKLKNERLQDPQLRKIVEDLQNYRQNLDVKVIGLEQKLRDGNQSNSIEYAERAKEQFFKKLLLHEMSETAQKINADLLALVESRFMNLVYPKICDGSSEVEIKLLVQEFIIVPLIVYLEDNPLEFNALHINGMLYYLTGNCHIKWTK